MARGWAIGLAMTIGAALRLGCLGAELWLDEIWSVDLAHEAGTVAGVFSLRHDNNHPLNTLWLLLVPDGTAPAVYRLHSLLAGLLTIALAGTIAARFGTAAVVFTSLLFAGSYWLVLASTEARGYALAILFALAAFEALWRYLDTGSRLALVSFWACSALGLLAHLTFVLAYLAFVAWSLRRFAARRVRPGDELRQLLLCHGVPGLAFASYYLLALRGMEVGGGPAVAMHEVILRLIARGIGWTGPTTGLAAFEIAFAVAVAGAFMTRHLARRWGDLWVFFAVAIIAAPALFLARRPPVLYERYLFLPYVFFLLLLGQHLGTIWQGEPAWPRHFRRGLVLVGMFLLLAGNTAFTLDYVISGRGQFREALAFVVAYSGEGPITVVGDVDIDKDFRARTYVRFYAPRVTRREIVYRTDGPADWALLHRLEPWLDGRPEPGEEITHQGATYRLVWWRPAEGLAWGWYVYLRA